MSSSSRDDLLSIYNNAVHAVDGRRQVASYLCQYPYDSAIALVAIGKAATSMTAGAFDVLGSRIDRALVITKHGYLNRSLLQNHVVVCLETAHPIPDASSLAAGQVLLDFIDDLPSRYPILFLISGGASALVEVLVPKVTLSDLQRVNQWLLGSGVDIHAVNLVRKRLSAIKGGGLATYLGGHPVLSLLISDVPGDDPQTIGAGLLTLHQETPLPVFVPDWIQSLMTEVHPLATPEHFREIEQHIIAYPAMARRAANEAAIRLGYAVHDYEVLITGDAVVAGRDLARQLCMMGCGMHIWSSETVMRLPEQPGQGGRCQSLALSAAYELAGQSGMYLLAAGTDGSDGPGDIAGALIDGSTIERGSCKGMDALCCLEQANAGSFLEASGDLIYTGPTGTNVMDIIIGVRV